MVGRTLSSLLVFLLAGLGALGQKVQIGVLGLFHPRQIVLSNAKNEAIVVSADDGVFVLEPGSSARIQTSGDSLLLNLHEHFVHAAEIHAAGRNGGPATFILEIPGRISRQYRGALVVKGEDGNVVPIVIMDLETAVASVVQAESVPNTPLEALKAQAVVTRSFFVAGKGRHHNFDFCDLTHCQFLRDPPGPESPAAVATSATQGLVITFEEKSITAMFTRSCGGHTRTLAELGISSNGYPYYSVLCEYCYESPIRWIRRISEQQAALLLGKGEGGRLTVDRQLGWNAVPSNNFTTRKEGGEVILEGAGQGHGIGLCQRGARAMAQAGASFREIIVHYFPNTALKILEAR